MIWRTILKLTNPSALHSDWHNCFNQVLPDMCKALEADELFLLDNSPPAGTPLSIHGNNLSNTYNHDWILSVPVWMNILKKEKLFRILQNILKRKNRSYWNRRGSKHCSLSHL